MFNSLWPHGPYSPWSSPGQNTGVGSISLLQGIFPAQGLNSGLPHCRWILYQLNHKGIPRILEWVACLFSSRSSRPRNQTGVSCTAGGFFTNWAIREAPKWHTQWVNNEIKEEIKNILRQWQWKHKHTKSTGAVKVVLVGKFIVIQPFLKKEEKSQINNLIHYLKELEEQTKEDKQNFIISHRRKEIINIRK